MRMELETPELNLMRERLKEKAKMKHPLSEEELIECIDVLKKSETSMRAERQELERQLRDMRFGRLLPGAEGG